MLRGERPLRVNSTVATRQAVAAACVAAISLWAGGGVVCPVPLAPELERAFAMS